MKINFAQSIKDINGKEILDESGKAAKLSAFCVNALLNQYKGEEDLQAEKKIERFKLAMEIKDAKELEIYPEQAVMIKELINKSYSTLIVGQIYDILK